MVYHYALYPLLIWVLSRTFGRVRPLPPEPLLAPFVSVVVSALNEEDVIGPRVVNALAASYPADRYEFVVASDGDHGPNCSHRASVRRSTIDAARFSSSPRQASRAQRRMRHRGGCLTRRAVDRIQFGDRLVLTDPASGHRTSIASTGNTVPEEMLKQTWCTAWCERSHTASVAVPSFRCRTIRWLMTSSCRCSSSWERRQNRVR